MDCGGHAVGQHVGGGEQRQRVGVGRAAPASHRDPGLEHVVGEAELQGVERAAVLMGVDEPGHQQAVLEPLDGGLGRAVHQLGQAVDGDDAAAVDQHRLVGQQQLGIGSGQDVVGGQNDRSAQNSAPSAPASAPRRRLPAPAA